MPGWMAAKMKELPMIATQPLIWRPATCSMNPRVTASSVDPWRKKTNSSTAIGRIAAEPRLVCVDSPVEYCPSAQAIPTPIDIMRAPKATPSRNLPTGLAPRNPTEEKRLPSLNRTQRNSRSRVAPKEKNSLNW